MIDLAPDLLPPLAAAVAVTAAALALRDTLSKVFGGSCLLTDQPSSADSGDCDVFGLRLGSNPGRIALKNAFSRSRPAISHLLYWG